MPAANWGRPPPSTDLHHADTLKKLTTRHGLRYTLRGGSDMQITILLPAGVDQSFEVEINQQPVSVCDIALAFIRAGIPVQSSPEPNALAWPASALLQESAGASRLDRP